MNARRFRPPFRPKMPASRRSVERGRRIVRTALRWATLSGVAVLGLLGYRLALTSPFFALTDIVVQNARQAPVADIMRLVGDVRGVNLLRVDTQGIADRVAQHPWVADATVRRRFPRTLIVRPRERVPVAVVRGSESMLIDANGVFLGPAGSDDLQRFVSLTGGPTGVLHAGAMAPAPLKQALDVLGDLQRRRPFDGLRIRRLVLLDSHSIEVHLQPNHVVVVMRSDNVAAQLARYAAVAAALGPGALSRLKINVSFVRQAVVRSL